MRLVLLIDCSEADLADGKVEAKFLLAATCMGLGQLLGSQMHELQSPYLHVGAV